MKDVLTGKLVDEQARLKAARENAETAYKDYLTESLSSLVLKHD